MSKSQFTLLESNLSKLDEKLAIFNRKAEKLGFPIASYKVIDTFTKTRKDEINGTEFVTVWKTIDLSGQTLKIEGWEFIGALDHKSIPGKTVIKGIPGVTIPEKFRESNNCCDHCGQERNRYNTFLLMKNGEYKRVGSTCVKDFIGHNPNNLPWFLGAFRDIEETIGSLGGSGEQLVYLDNLLAVTSAIIRGFGWVSKAKAAEAFDEISPTAVIVTGYLLDVKGEQSKRLRENYPVLDEDREAAKACIAWFNEQNADNDYMHNCTALAEFGLVAFSMFSIACSMLATYQRHLDRLKINNLGKLNEHFGTIKKREVFTLTLTKKVFFDNQFGGTYQHIFCDDQGRCAVWWASNDKGLIVGETIKAKATVKEHAKYKEQKQTIINRLVEAA